MSKDDANSENDKLKSNLMTDTIFVNYHNLMNQDIDLKDMLRTVEHKLIENALDKSNGVVSHAASKLGLRRTTLIEKMKKYNIAK